jgi:cell wall-associated NlpC family hydrolase
MRFPIERRASRKVVAASVSFLLFSLECQPQRRKAESALAACPQALRDARQALFSAGRAVVLPAVADLLSRPDPRASLADQALLGDEVLVPKSPPDGCTLPAGEWVQVETAAHYRAFIAVAALRPLAAGQAAYRDSGPLLRVSARLANIYEQPTVTAQRPLIAAPLFTRLRSVRTVDSRWLEVLLPDGRRGFIQAGDVEPEEAAPASSASAGCVLEQALRYLGTPYLWGGRSTLGIDCSGLVSNAFSACGIVPPRDARPQRDWSALIPIDLDPSALKPADLLFFGEKKDGAPPKVTHVGIYLGNGRFVHATTHEHPVVKESSLGDPHWQSIWLAARRYPWR